MVLSVKNNNPGNMRSPSGGFQQFDTPDDGISAMRKDLLLKIMGNSKAMKANYGEGYSPTLSNLISTWAPPTENNTANYIDFVSKNSGLHPDQPLAQEDVDKILPAMIQMEGGAKASNYFGKGKQYADAGNIMTDAQVDAGNPDEYIKWAVEADKRGLLKPEEKTWLDEARKRGIAPAGEAKRDSTSFTDNVGKIVEKGQANAHAFNEGEIGPARMAISALGTAGGPVGEAYSEAGKSIGEALSSMVPDGVKEYASDAMDNSAMVQAVKALGGFLSNEFQQSAKEYPEQASIAEDLGNASNLIPLIGGAKAIFKAGETALPIIKNSVTGSAEAVSDRLSKGVIPKKSLPKDMQKVYDRLRKEYPDDADFNRVLNSYASKPDQALVEVGGKRVENLAEGAAVYPTGNAKAVEFFDRKTSELGDKLKTTLSKTVSSSTNFSDDVDNLLETGRAKASPIYKKAFAKNQSVSSPVIDKILATPEGRSSLSDAVKNIQNEIARVAVPDPELTQLAKEASEWGLMERPTGNVAAGLKLRTLDEVKRAMDLSIRKAYRTGDEAEGGRITALKNSLVEEMDNADKSGLYKKARATSGDYLTTKQAMEDGLKFLSDDVENIPRRLNSLTKSQKEAYKAGVVKKLRNEVDGRVDGQNVARIFTREATRKKLQSILLPTEYSKLLNEVKTTDNIYKLRNQLTSNSRTALRQAASEEFIDDGAEIITEIAKNGFIKTGIDRVGGFIARQFDGMSDKLAGDVANILYETDPKKKYQIVKQLVNQANAAGKSKQKTDAINKLSAFYAVSDKIAKEHP